jgi:hippurate hydrolase
MNDECQIELLCSDLTELRRDLHAHPEIAFEERRTSDLVAERLQEMGADVDRGLARTGVVGTLQLGDGPAIGLRADMDALEMSERTGLPYASRFAGRMHACGHDGHTAMLLGAAQYLADHGGFSGTVRFIFQPAEENLAGGKLMVDEGLFDRFPMTAVFGLHNRPGLEAGVMGVRAGPVMACADFFDLRLTGVGGHAAYPHTAQDPIVAAAQIIGAWQTLVSRGADPLESAVVSVTRIRGGHTTNVIPAEVSLSGTIRAFREDVRSGLESGLRRMAESIAAAHGVVPELGYARRYRATVNAEAEVRSARSAMRRTVGEDRVREDLAPSMGAEDFGWMLERCPGAYGLIGNGAQSRPLHNPEYDFNDAILPIGVRYWVNLVRELLPPAGAGHRDGKQE